MTVLEPSQVLALLSDVMKSGMVTCLPQPGGCLLWLPAGVTLDDGAWKQLLDAISQQRRFEIGLGAGGMFSN